MDILTSQMNSDSHAQMRFLRHLNHSIRTPLNGILSFLDIIHIGFGDKLPQKYHHYCKISKSSAKDLHHVLDQIQHYSDTIDKRITPDALRLSVKHFSEDPYQTEILSSKKEMV